MIYPQVFKTCSRIIFLLLPVTLLASPPREYTKYDYQRGKLTALRTSFDVKQYEITLKVEPSKKFISGSNRISMYAVKDFSRIQLDLYSNMKIDSMVMYGKRVYYTRDSNAVFVNMPVKVKKNTNQILTVYFSGHPVVAKKAPWDGGFVWSKDSSGYDWVGLACEGIGASCWLPCKDHASDEADSLKVHLIVPDKLIGVSNGKKTGEKDLGNGFKQFDWTVRNPINNYNISVNVGHYAHLHDEYHARYTEGLHVPLALDYYVLTANKEKARKHFMQVTRMMECFEKYFGAYPFWEDGYKLVETPFWGMEHQSCVAYGNNYENNRFGFDFIIIHESAHEWFGNSISCKDPAELWIHETFTTYAESVFVEEFQGKAVAVKYLMSQKHNIEAKYPMIGVKDVYYHDWSDNDIYYKGSWMLHTIRNVIDNDTLWFNSLKDFSLRYKKQQVTTEEVIGFFAKRTGYRLEGIFRQYLYTGPLPVFEYKLIEGNERGLELHYRWQRVNKSFTMPIKTTMTKGEWDFLEPIQKWRIIDLNYFDPKEFKVQTDHFLLDVKKD